MTRVVAVALLCAWASAPECFPWQDPAAGARAAREVRHMHAEYYRTLTKEGPDAALEQFYADEYTYIGVDGKLIDKTGLKARMKRNELALFTVQDELERISIYGDVAVLSGHSTSNVNDRGEVKTSREGYTEVWVKRDGRWQLVAEQITLQDR